MITFTLCTPDSDKESIVCLFNNIDLIRANKKFVLSKKKYRDIRIDGIYTAGLYVGGKPIPLGVLLNLWDETDWQTEDNLYFHIVGSPLSGSNSCAMFNLKKKKIIYSHVNSWHTLAPIAFEYIQKSKDQIIMNKRMAIWRRKNEKEKRLGFAEWSKRLDEGKLNYTPIPKRSKTATIQQLVDVLKNKQSER